MLRRIPRSRQTCSSRSSLLESQGSRLLRTDTCFPPLLAPFSPASGSVSQSLGVSERQLMPTNEQRRETQRLHATHQRRRKPTTDSETERETRDGKQTLLFSVNKIDGLILFAFSSFSLTPSSVSQERDFAASRSLALLSFRPHVVTSHFVRLHRPFIDSLFRIKKLDVSLSSLAGRSSLLFLSCHQMKTRFSTPFLEACVMGRLACARCRCVSVSG